MVFVGQVSTTDVAAGTVNVAEQVLLASHELVTVKVTVLVPPTQAKGAPLLLLVIKVLHPPVTETVASQLVNAVSI